MKQTQEQIEKLRTLQESYDDLADAVENQLPAIQEKIDNIKLPEIDTTELAKESTLQEVSSKLGNVSVDVDLSAIAKQGSNAEATNSAIYALLSQFGESVLQEKVTVILNCQESIAWHDYVVNVTFEDGRMQAVPLSENGTCSFSIKIGQNYSVQLPFIGIFIAPELKTYTAISPSREIYWSYVAMGIFGIDELGRRYTLEQIEALQDKSIIKYGGYTDETLENAQKNNGSLGCGFMWELDNSKAFTSGLTWASSNIEFSQELLPFLTTEESKEYYDGSAYTGYIISEGTRLSVDTPAATWCREQQIIVNGKTKRGFLASAGQCYQMLKNFTNFKLLYELLGLTWFDFNSSSTSNAIWTSCQADATRAIYMYRIQPYIYHPKVINSFSTMVVYEL